MRRTAFAVVVMVGSCAAPVRAETLPLVEGLPATYTPNQEFSFFLRVPRLPDLEAYNVQMVFSTNLTNPPLVVFPTVTPEALDGRYVFGSNAGFSFTFDSPDGSTDVSLTISDPPSSGPPNAPTFAVPGTNDTLAKITVVPGADLSGDIVLSFATDFRYSVSEAPPYAPPDSFTIPQASGGTGNPVPAPPGVLLLGLGGLLVATRARCARRAA